MIYIDSSETCRFCNTFKILDDIKYQEIRDKFKTWEKLTN